MRKTFIAIAAAAVIALSLISAPLPALAWDSRDQVAYDGFLRGDAEMHAMAACLANQVKTHGWVRHGPKDKINTLYASYGEACYDKIRPTMFDDSGPGSGRIIWSTSAQWFECHVDDYAAPESDNEPMTCTDPTAQKLMKWNLAAEYLTSHGPGGKYEGQ
jgi:hypothetical protein